MKVVIDNLERREIETILYATVYDKMTADEQGIMNQFVLATPDLWVGFIDGEVACVWGCVPPTLMSSHAYLWLYTTEAVKEHQFLFIRHSQVALGRLLEKYDSIIGTAVIGNEQAIRWLKWLGAEFLQPVGKKLPFVIRKKHG